MAGNGFGGLIQGLYGNYQAASDGSFTVDTRDAINFLPLGFTYLNKSLDFYATPIVPLAATVGKVVASGALSNGTSVIAAQPDVMRPITVEFGAGASAITAGTATVTYIGNDSQTHVDVFTAVCAANASTTQTTSYGVVTVSSIVIAGVVGGTSPWFRSSTTAALSLPIGVAGVDIVVTREYDAGATIAVGSLGVSIGSIYPTTPPNGTATYSFGYAYASPDI